MEVMDNMFEVFNTANDAFEHWYGVLSEMAEEGFEADSRDGDVVGEILNAVSVIEDPTRGIVTSEVRKMPMRYAVGELLWYLSGNNNLSEIQKYTKAWDRMSDDGVTVNSNYGWCIHYKYGFDQWDFIKDELRTNPASRRAVIHIKEPSDMESKDVNCTCTLQFFIRDKKLYMTTYMRSNDVWMGFPYDVFQFTALQVLLSMELGIELGTYTHIAGSLHLYKRDLKVKKG